MSECGLSCGCAHGKPHHHSCADNAEKPVNFSLELTHHDDAAVATVSFCKNGTPQGLEKELSDAIASLAEKIKERGGVVGHIKGAMTGEPDVTTFSSTGDSVSVSRKSERHYHIKIVVIIVGLDDANLELAIKEAF